MTMPRFTAGASLYKASGHYQTGRQAITLPTQMISVIYPAEIIEVHSCPPGWTDFGGTCFPDPLTEPSGGGGGGLGTPGVPFEGGDGGGGGKGGGTSPKPRPTPEEKARAREIGRCKARCEGTWTAEQLTCAFDEHPDICRSISDNTLSRCKTRCDEDPGHNAPIA